MPYRSPIVFHGTVSLDDVCTCYQLLSASVAHASSLMPGAGNAKHTSQYSTNLGCAAGTYCVVVPNDFMTPLLSELTYYIVHGLCNHHYKKHLYYTT